MMSLVIFLKIRTTYLNTGKEDLQVFTIHVTYIKFPHLNREKIALDIFLIL